MTVIAQYDGRCWECFGKVESGQEIVIEDRTWRHAVCPPGKLDILRDVCGECFTERSVDGSCLCGAV
jgi:hypothetical protein